MSNLLCLTDSYLKECEANVVNVKDGKYITLDVNLFYPKGGGQPCDTGKLLKNGDAYNLVSVDKIVGFEGDLILTVDKEGLKQGDKVKCVLNWERRYKLMRSHTAAHVLGSIMYKDAGVLITGNQLEENKIRFDFNFENFDRAIFDELVKKANEVLQKDIELKIYTLPRDEAMKIGGVVKLAVALPPSINELRIVEIPGVDIQADGGTHVKNLKEVGQIELLKLENKGKDNRRIYFKINP